MDRILRTLSFAFLMSVVIATGVVDAAPPPKKLALTNAQIIPVVGPTIAKGTIVIEDGKIAAIGVDVEIPYDAVEIDLTGKVLLPGTISPHSAGGLDVTNESLPVTPFVDVYDAIDPSRLYFEESLRNGMTSVHVIVGNNCVVGGVSRLVHPIGRTPDEMTQRSDIALKLSISPRRGFDRMLQMVTIRETFAELKDYLSNLAERRYEEDLKEKGEEIAVGPEEARERGQKLIRDGDYDDRHRNLVRLTKGKLAAWVYCGEAMDVAPAIKVAKDEGFFDRLILVIGSSAHKAILELKSAGRPIVVDAELLHRERDRITGEVNETFIPRVLYDAGLKFALTPRSSSSLAERYLTYQAARCVRHGIPRERALEAITLHPAEILGVADSLGSLEVGKVANVVVLSGDPFDFNTWVEKVYVRGILAYEKEKDPRLKTLLGDKKEDAKDDAKKSSGEKGETPKEQPKDESPVPPDEKKTPKETEKEKENGNDGGTQ